MTSLHKRSGISAVLIALSLTSAMPARAGAADAVSDQSERYKNLELFQSVLHYVEANYVDPVKNKDLIYGAIKGMLETLDPHSNFLTPEIFKDMQTETSGKFGGLALRSA